MKRRKFVILGVTAMGAMPVMGFPVSYAKSFPFSGVSRIRRESWDATILSNNPGWFTFQTGDLSKMPRINRPKSEIQHLKTVIKITEITSGNLVLLYLNIPFSFPEI